MCSMCKDGYGLLLSGSSTSCVVLNSHTKNCLYLDARYGSEQQCLICRPGYYFNKGGCEKRGLSFEFPWTSKLNLPAISFSMLLLFLKLWINSILFIAYSFFKLIILFKFWSKLIDLFLRLWIFKILLDFAKFLFVLSVKLILNIYWIHYLNFLLHLEILRYHLDIQEYYLNS